MQNETPEQRAVLAAQYQSFGPPEVLRIVEVPAPAAGPGDLVVKVTAVSVNRIDAEARAGRSKVLSGRQLPQPTCLDFAGEVVGVDPQVSGFELGQCVWGFLGTDRLGKQGTAASQIVVDAALAAVAPASRELADLAALPLAGVTAWQAMEELGVGPDSRLLIVGGAGGVGSVAVQVARARGAIVDTISSARHEDLLRRLGAESRFDPDAVEWPKLAGRYQAVFDTTGKNLWPLRGVVVPSGRLLTISPAGMPVSFLTKILPGPTISFMSVKPSRAGLDALADMVERGQLVPIIRTRFPLAEIAKAHALVETGHGQGKVLVDIG
ncbi:MAG: NADP-dependent oxidoreductase [Propionibacteriaceae bacterium]|nr:NADP-dependent oxidoreductase [Propionibacteriaceae bacterium]